MSEAKSVGEIARDIENALRPLLYERAVILDETGNVLLEKTAAPDAPYEIEFSEEEIALMRASQGVVFTHNHPQGWKYDVNDPRRAGHSFSPEDVFLACRAELTEMRAVSPKYRFSIKPTDRGWNEGFWAMVETVFQTEYAAVNRALTMEVVSGRLASNRFQADLLHTTWTRVAALLGMTYERREE